MSLQVEIEKLVYGGQGLGRCNGRVVLAPFVLPGEKVVVEPERVSADLITARTVAVESPSPWRVPAPCPYFGSCGGCHYQHMPYTMQLATKRAVLLETLARIGKMEWSGPVEVVADEPWAYRNRVQLRVRKQDGRFEIGYFEHGSHRLLPVDHCPISAPAINSAIAALARMGRDRRFPNFLREVELFTNGRELQLNVIETARPVARRFFDWCAQEIEGFQQSDFLDYPVGPAVYRVSRRSFFQVNRFLLPRLAGIVVGDAGGGTAVDLYAGVGLFSLRLARQFLHTVAVDSNRSACLDLVTNAERAGVALEIRRAPAEDFLAGFSGSVDLLLADPPRAGLGRSVTELLTRLRPRRLIVISCDPSTLARDLRALISGGFQLNSLKFIDLFPQTFHIESVAELIS
jgi:23S rRNA (uracil1939-C5)-methyltransferase